MFSEMAQNVHEASKLLKKMMGNPNEMQDLADSIKALEHKGDRMIHDLMAKLNKTFVVPIDREDIYALASKIDDVIDLTGAEQSDEKSFRKIESMRRWCQRASE